MGEFNSRVRKANSTDENIEQYGKVTNNRNGQEMLKFLEHNEVETVNDRL